MKEIDIYSLLKQTQKKLIPTLVSKGDAPADPMSLPGIYARDIVAREGTATEDRTFVPYRTLGPQTDYVYGADKLPLAKIDNSTSQTPPIGPVPNQMPVFRGWRPHRPKIDYKDLGMEILQDQQGPGIESVMPQERELVNRAEEHATMPFPTLPEPMEITDSPESGKGIYLDAPQEVADEGNMHSMNGMGDDVTDTISALAKNVASSIQAKYGTDPNAIKAAAAAQSKIPWGTLALVGIVGAAAIYFIPKMTR